MWLPRSVINDVHETVDEVFYVNYQTTKVFNESRTPGVPLVFSGWYWAKGPREGGPFKSQSAAYRDAWYRLCSRTKMPLVHETARGEIRRQERTAKRETIGLRVVA